MPSFSISASSSTSTVQLARVLLEVLRLFGQVAGRADVAGQVAEVLGEFHAGGDGRAVLDGGLAVAEVATGWGR
jgi:hypothetical protein